MPTNEQYYYDVLKRIAKDYHNPASLKRSVRNGPLDYEEALEMAYENIQGEAAHAIKGKRRPADVGSSASPAGEKGQPNG